MEAFKRAALSPFNKQRIQELEGENERLREALAGLYGLVESGDLVRDISKDHETDWALKQLPFVAKLSAAQKALSHKESEERG